MNGSTGKCLMFPVTSHVSSLFHDDFIEYSVFRIWQFDFERSRFDIKSLVTKSNNDIFDDALRQMELWS